MKTNLQTALNFAYSMLLMISSARAQSATALQQVDAARQRSQVEQTGTAALGREDIPELFPGESADIGPQSVLKKTQATTWVEFMGDAQYFYTDNLFFTETQRRGVDIFVGTARLTLTPPSIELGSGRISLRAGYQHQWFDFGPASSEKAIMYDSATKTFALKKVNVANFNGQTLFAETEWRRGNFAITAGFDNLRLFDASYDQFYREYVPRIGLQQSIPLNSRSAFTIGYLGDYRYSDSDIHAAVPLPSDLNDRMDQAIFVSFTQILADRVAVQPYYRFQYTRFTTGPEREDLYNSFGLAVHWFPISKIGIRGFVGYDILESSLPVVADYRRFSGGVGLNVAVHF